MQPPDIIVRDGLLRDVLHCQTFDRPYLRGSNGLKGLSVQVICAGPLEMHFIGRRTERTRGSCACGALDFDGLRELLALDVLYAFGGWVRRHGITESVTKGTCVVLPGRDATSNRNRGIVRQRLPYNRVLFAFPWCTHRCLFRAQGSELPLLLLTPLR